LRSIRILLLALLSIGVAAAAAPRERTLLVFGDSLSAAYGLRADQGWVAQLQQRLVDQGYGYRVVNASVSGETTAGGMIAAIQKRGARVLLTGILMPPNYGARYASEFSAMYTELARAAEVPLIPFLLGGIALDQRYMQPDGLHPNAAGQPLVLENVWKHLRPLLER
jgi:acyl-CoA thioesterase-1